MMPLSPQMEAFLNEHLIKVNEAAKDIRIQQFTSDIKDGSIWKGLVF